MVRLHKEIQGYLKDKKELERSCKECDHGKNFANFNLLKLIEGNINYTRHEINKIEWDVDTWSYTIRGNKEAENINDEIIFIMMKYITDGENKKYNYDYPKSLVKEFFERAFDEIVSYVLKQNSRLAFQVLGRNILLHGARMPREIKDLILLHSEWEDEQDQFDNNRDREERKHYLLDFREKVDNYKEGNPVKIPHQTQREIYERSLKDRNGFILIDRDRIDYRAMKE